MTDTNHTDGCPLKNIPLNLASCTCGLPKNTDRVEAIVENLFEDTVGMTDYLDQFENSADAEKFANACKQVFRTTIQATHSQQVEEAVKEMYEIAKTNAEHYEGSEKKFGNTFVKIFIEDYAKTRDITLTPNHKD